MNYFKLLLCALLAIPSAGFAMQEPIEPKVDQQLQLLIKAGVDSEQKCAGACQKQAKYLPGDSLRITGCCWQFICAHDAAKISKDCPFCKKEFSAKSISLSNENESFHFIDNDGVEYKIGKFTNVQALKKCITLRNLLANAGGIADFRSTHSALTQHNMILLAEYINNPKIIPSLPNDQNMNILKLADYLDAPENVLHELSNLLWEHLQEKFYDSKEVKEEKKQLRSIAEPYLHCPAYLYLALQGKLDRVLSNNKIDLSYEHLQQVFAADKWISDEKGNFYNLSHKLITIRGLDTIISDMARSAHSLPVHINLKNNSIGHIDGKFFEFAKNFRSSNRPNNIVIDLQNNSFTAAQKKEIEKKLYEINYTLPERVNWNAIKKCITYPLYAILPLSNVYLARNITNDLPKLTSMLAVTSGLAAANVCSNIITGAQENHQNGIDAIPMLASLFPTVYAGIHLENKFEKSYGAPSDLAIAIMIPIIIFSSSCYFAPKATHHVTSWRNKLSDILSRKLARITHPAIQARNYSDLENAKRVIVKL